VCVNVSLIRIEWCKWKYCWSSDFNSETSSWTKYKSYFCFIILNWKKKFIFFFEIGHKAQTYIVTPRGAALAWLPTGVRRGEVKRCFIEMLRTTRKVCCVCCTLFVCSILLLLQWRLADSHRPRLKTLKGHTAAVTKLALCAAAGRLFSGSLDCDIKQWDVTRGEQVCVCVFNCVCWLCGCVCFVQMTSDSQLLCAHSQPVTALYGDWPEPDDDNGTAIDDIKVLRLYSGL